MKMLKFIFTGILCTYFSISNAQQYTFSSYAQEAVLFSQPSVNGTARISGLGGANVSLGGDLSNISSNPAGLGFFNKSSWSLTTALRLGLYESSPARSNAVRNSTGINVQLPNISLAFHQEFEEVSGWVSGTFGIGYNQKNYFFNGINYQNTLVSKDGFINDYTEYALAPFLDQTGNFIGYGSESEAEDAIFNDFYADLAYNAGLLNIYENTNTGQYEIDRYDYDPNGYLTTEVSRREIINTTGGLTTVDLAYGANYQDKLFVGGAININFLNYEINKELRETPNNGLISSYTLNENRILSGTGAGLTLGLIYKPINLLNIGISYSSPSFMVIQETQTLTMTPFGNQFGEREIVNDVPSYSYVNPQKISAGASAFISKYGFVTADISYINYSTAKYTSNQGAFGSGELRVNQELKSALNASLGLEARLGVLRLRAGYAYYQNPYNNDYIENQYLSDNNPENDNDFFSFNQDRNVISAGVGIFKDGFSIDATLNLENRNNAPLDSYNSGILTNSSSSINTLRVSLAKSF